MSHSKAALRSRYHGCQYRDPADHEAARPWSHSCRLILDGSNMVFSLDCWPASGLPAGMDPTVCDKVGVSLAPRLQVRLGVGLNLALGRALKA